MNMADFLHMGGYAAYVWPSYALACFVLVYNIVQPLRHERLVRRRLSRRLRAAAQRGEQNPT